MRCSARTLAVSGQVDPLYGDGQNGRDWPYAEDHVDALAMASALTSRWWRRSARRSSTFCWQGLPTASRISSELDWEPRHSFECLGGAGLP